MTGKLCVVLSALLVCCGLSLVNAQYQSRHLLIDLRYNGQFRSKHDVVLPDGRQLDKLRTYNVALSFGYLF